jgi:Protein of unknown function (DUF2840)
MIDAPSNRPMIRKATLPNEATADDLTQVHLTWIKGRIEHWIRFGTPSGEIILNAERRVITFPPENVVAFVRWASNDFGTIQSRIDILRTVPKGAAHQTIPYVRPGGELLLRLHGWPVVETVLQAIDAIEARGIDPAIVAPEHWRHVHNRLSIGHDPRPYSAAQHRAWVLRKRAGS